jgi:hypothetical protein
MDFGFSKVVVFGAEALHGSAIEAEILGKEHS